ncbi:MAG TPA: RDD family protein [Mycobacteriales bacterium]|nr:RDD family protein [Mycobacteriales bacterium]
MAQQQGRTQGPSELRRALGTWLEGPPRRVSAGYPGERLRLPEAGRGSVASFGEKLVAFVVDLVVSALISVVIIRPHTIEQERTYNVVAVGVFVVLTAGLLMASGRSAGHRLMALQVVRLDGRTVGVRALLRQVLVALLVPALITNSDRRGLHDRACGTVVVRVR